MKRLMKPVSHYPSFMLSLSSPSSFFSLSLEICLPGSRGRPANDEFCFQIVVRAFSPFQLQHPVQCLEGGRPHPLAGNSDGGQWRGVQETKGGVVAADNGDVFRSTRYPPSPKCPRPPRSRVAPPAAHAARL